MDLVRQLPETVRLRAEASGEAGIQWLDQLPGLLSRLEQDWSFIAGQILDGGSEALVMTAACKNGVDAILKIALPESEGITQEASVMMLADGRGYAKVLEHDDINTAMLLERLGDKLVEQLVDEQLVDNVAGLYHLEKDQLMALRKVR